MRLPTGTSLLIAALAIHSWSAFAQEDARATASGNSGIHETSPKSLSDSPKSAGLAKCEIAGDEVITITCVYTASPRSDSYNQDAPRIVLNRAVLSFSPKSESHMLVELTFTNDSTKLISEHRTVYLAVDGEDGRNYVRRPLPSVDLSALKPGESQTSSEHLRIAGFRGGARYVIHLWIPDPDPSLKFNATHNLLLSNVGVGDPATGLNTLAQFTVDPWKRSR
jgi:hypothetical protein